MPLARTLHSLHTHWNADSVEFAPSTTAEEAAGVRTFVCGNYQLHEDTREKVGRIYLYQLQPPTGQEEQANASTVVSESSGAVAAAAASTPAAVRSSAAASAPKLVQQQVLDTKAIFDLKW